MGDSTSNLPAQSVTHRVGIIPAWSISGFKKMAFAKYARAGFIVFYCFCYLAECGEIECTLRGTEGLKMMWMQTHNLSLIYPNYTHLCLI